MSSSVFYSDERSVVEREVETRVRPSRAVGELVDYYELDRCVQFVEAGEFKKVSGRKCRLLSGLCLCASLQICESRDELLLAS
jgi:DTW domain-containing protein YfiP